MANEKMNRCKNQLRWRKTYKKRDLCITPAELGGTGYDDTVVPANRWVTKRMEEIDAEIALAKRQPLADVYRSEQEEMETAIKVLTKIKDDDPIAGELIETMKVKCRNLQRTSQDEDTPVPGLSLLNPLRISLKELEEESENEEAEKMFCSLLDNYLSNKHNETWLNMQGYIVHSKEDVTEPNNLEWSLGIRMGVYPDPSTNRRFRIIEKLCLARFPVETELEQENGDLLRFLNHDLPPESSEDAVDRANTWLMRRKAREAFHKKTIALEAVS